jgi:hypothetical protein
MKPKLAVCIRPVRLPSHTEDQLQNFKLFSIELISAPIFVL